jgi:hypothetical protein
MEEFIGMCIGAFIVGLMWGGLAWFKAWCNRKWGKNSPYS